MNKKQDFSIEHQENIEVHKEIEHQEDPRNEVHSAKNRLQNAIHHLLVLGVGFSSAMMVLGLLLDFIFQRPVPNTVPPFDEIFQRLLAFRPSGFLAFGLLVLIATPVLPLFGSIITFLYERDWRYAGITFVVFMVVITSIVLGQG